MKKKYLKPLVQGALVATAGWTFFGGIRLAAIEWYHTPRLTPTFTVEEDSIHYQINDWRQIERAVVKEGENTVKDTTTELEGIIFKDHPQTIKGAIPREKITSLENVTVDVFYNGKKRTTPIKIRQ